MARLLNWLPWRRRRLERELERELRYHVDRRTDDLIRSGADPVEARRQVALEFGGISQVQDDVRETWILRSLDHLVRDVRLAVRTLLRTPAFTVPAVVSLALGIGANAAIFSLVDQVLLRSLPVAKPEQLVQVAWHGNSLSSSWGVGHLLSYPLCRDLEAARQFFDGVFCRYPTEVNLEIGKPAQSVAAEIVSGSYFPVLGVKPALGRLLDESDDRQPGAHPVVVLSARYWKTHLDGAGDVVGRKVLVNNSPMTVIGIAPASFPGVDPLEPPALWIPASMKREATPEWDRLLDRRAVWMHVFGRLASGVTSEQAASGLQPWFRTMLDEDTRRPDFPKATDDQRRAFLVSTLELTPAARGLSNARGPLERPLVLLMGGTLLLVLLASLNVASLLLARSAARSREVMTRMALGASRRRIASQLLVESLVIALAGGLLGLVAAPAVSRLLSALLPGNAELAHGLDGRVLLFAFVVSAATGLLSGLAPVWHTRRSSLVSKERSALSAGGAIRLRKAIVVAQIAFALVLLIGAGLFVQTLVQLHARDLGFSRRGLFMVRVEPDAVGYSPAAAPQLVRTVLEHVQALPVVEHAAIANSSMLNGGSAHRMLTIEGQPRQVTERPVPVMRVGPGFFSTVGAELVAGRDFTVADARDVETAGYRAIVVNESFARRYFAGRNPVGQRLGIGNQPNTPTTIEIVGLIKDFSFRVVREDAEPEHAFLPFAETGPLAGNGTLYVKVRGEPGAAAVAIRTAVEQIDSRLPVEPRSVDEQLEQALSNERMLATLSSGFGALALILSVVGLYGVMSFVVTRRTQEIGLRLALGATRASAVSLIVREALLMIAAGTAAAVPAAWALRQVVESQLFGVNAFDAPTIAGASALLALVALAAALGPALRAASVNPTEALRLD